MRDTLYRRLQPFRHPHDCSGCFRLERSPGGTCTHWKSAALPRRTPIGDIGAATASRSVVAHYTAGNADRNARRWPAMAVRSLLSSQWSLSPEPCLLRSRDLSQTCERHHQNQHDEAHPDERGRSAGEVCQATGKSCLDSWFRRHKRPLGEDGCHIDLDHCLDWRAVDAVSI